VAADNVERLLVDMGSSDFHVQYEATEKLKKTIFSDDRKKFDITTGHLSTIANYKTAYDAEKATELLALGQTHHLMGSYAPDADAQRRARMQELAPLLEQFNGPQKDAVIKSLEKYGLQTPRTMEAQKQYLAEKAAEEKARIDDFAARGEITSHKFFRLFKDKDGELKFGNEEHSASVKDTAYKASASANNGVRTNLYPGEHANIRRDLEKVVATGNGPFTPADLKKYDEQTKLGHAQYDQEHPQSLTAPTSRRGINSPTHP
jgi:hypothetical protein